MRIRAFLRSLLSAGLSVAVMLVSGCATELVPGINRPSNAHESYYASLVKAGLGNSVLVKKWKEASGEAVANPLTVVLPYREDGYFDPSNPDATGYKFHAVRGRHITIEFDTQDDSGTMIYADLFRMERDRESGTDVPAQVASRGAVSTRIDFEPRKDGWYVFRLQPELLKGGRFSITAISDASLAFPVEGSSMKSIIGLFGDPRDGGSRLHEGVDIAAKKGTPVTAPSRAFVSRVGRTDLGGNVVWLWDQERSVRMYFAHLDTQSVSTGTWVNPGDLIGTVGNSGNAALTPFHLHFGVYPGTSGAVDPVPFISPSPAIPDFARKEAGLYGGWARTKARTVSVLDTDPRSKTAPLQLPKGSPVRVMGETAEYIRVTLPDGRAAFIRASELEPAESTLSRKILSRRTVLMTGPGIGAEETGILPEGEELSILGSWGRYLFVKTSDGRNAWIDPEAS